MADPYAASRGDNLTDVFWSHLEAYQFALQVCDSCAQTWFPATRFCPRCHSIAFHWKPASGDGTVWTYSRVELAPSPALQAEVPYWLVVVELAEGPRVLGRLHGARDEEIEIGLPVGLVIDPPKRPGDRARYSFEPRAVTASAHSGVRIAGS